MSKSLTSFVSSHFEADDNLAVFYLCRFLITKGLAEEFIKYVEDAQHD
jgi:hypothetical protein